jgi:glycosyltransferase involved in cell wall biosynthesis
VKLAWVLYGGLEQKTGGTIYDRIVVEGLRSAGDDVTVVSIAEGATDLARTIRACACEVVVGDELCFRELAVAFPELEGSVRRVLLVHHLTGWESETLLADEHRAIETCDAIIATSVATRERLIAEGARAPIDVVVPGADRLDSKGAHARTGDRPLAFTFLGTVTPRKRVKELVRAFARGVKDGDGTLAIVGSTTRDQTYVRDVVATIDAHGIAARVVMTGEVDDDGVKRALDDADVLVMPSSLEGWGIAATEAINAGVPVIAARAQGLVEALAPCPGATIFADEEHELATALERFATDASLRERMRDAARAAADRMPAWSDCVASFRAAMLAR